jgi:hypothetical protein
MPWPGLLSSISSLSSFSGSTSPRRSARGIVEAADVTAAVIFAALIGAIIWNLITWGLGIPSSSSHALIGGLLGAGITKAGIGTVVWSGVIKTTLGIFLAPILGLGVALLLMLAVAWLFRRVAANRADRFFRRTQLFTAALYSLGHGGNDAQKTMGIIAVLLYSQGMLAGGFHVPFWVIISCQAAMGLGTLMGGWRIVHTMGSKITRLTPSQGRLRRAWRLDHVVSVRPGSESRYRRLTRSRVRSWAWELHGACRRALGRRGQHSRRLVRHLAGIGADGRPDLRPRAVVLRLQHSTTLTARPPRLVSL